MRPNGSQDQCVDIPFTGGMAEGVAPFVFNGPFVESAEDCVITKEGAYKRFGGGRSITQLPSTTGGSRGISVFDSTLIQHTVEGPQQFNETLDSWRASNVKGFVPTQPRTDLVISQSDRMVYNTQVAISSSGYELYCWDETYPGSRDTSQFYAGGWTGKGLAIRDPDGGWTISPSTIENFGDGPGHQIIAIGTNFLVGFTTATGFQVYKIADTATDIVTAAVQIVTNATGSTVTGGGTTTEYGALHDVCLSTSGAYAYFLVAQYAGLNAFVYTVDATGQIGTASTGANGGQGAWAICVDNSKVYLAESGRSGAVTEVRLSKVAEGSISAGTAATVIGTFTVTGSRAYRVRTVGDAGKGILIAVEGLTTAVTTDLPLDTFIPTGAYPSYLSLPSGRYVEVGFLPTSDAILDYTSSSFRAYAHSYVLGSGWSVNTNRKPQILLTFDDRLTVGAATVLGDGTSGVATYDYGHWYAYDTSGPFKGAIWVDCVDYVTEDQEGSVTAFKFRSLTRVAWDSAMSDWDVETLDGDERWVMYNRSSLSRVVNSTFALTAQLDAVTTGGRRCNIDIDPKPPLSVLSHGDLFFDGGCQAVWDGQHSFENTPHFPPVVGWVPAETPFGDPALIEAPDPPAITSCAPGYTDVWSFYWEWADANGYLHRSAIRQLSIEMTGPMTSGGASHYVFGINNKGGYFAVLPPLSANDRTTFRNLRLVTSYVPGTGTTTRSVLLTKYTVDWTQTVGAFTPLVSTLAERIFLAPALSRELGGYLYTDGGVLEANAPPAPISITSTRDRLWLISADNRRQVYFSKPLEALIAPEFNANLTVDIPADAGEGVVLLTVDDKPVILCERGLYFISGDGPNALGTQGAFVPTVIQSDTGCREKNSVARCDYGGFFQGERGIYLLDRGLNVQLVSQGVQDQAGGDISKAVAVPKEQQVRFGLTTGGILVYHYALKAWTKLNLTAIDAVIWDDAYTRLWDVANCGIVRTETTDDGQDAESVITMKIVTAWIKADKMQGFARFKKALLLMSQQGGPYDYGPITVDTYFNYEYIPEEFTGYSETVTFANADRKPAEYRAQNQLTIGRQKSESVKFVITSPNYELNGEVEDFYTPLSLEGLALVVGTITSTQFRHLKQQLKN